MNYQKRKNKNGKEEKSMKKIEKNESEGITLIALVVTIVVLLILAGISISIVLGEGGIIDSARKAGELTNAAIANEQQMLQNLVDWADEYLSGNGGSTNTEEQPPEPEVSITIEKTKESIKVGETLEITAKVSPEGTEVTWNSNDKKIAIVKENGTVIGKKAGEVEITAEAKGKSATCNLTIEKTTVGEIKGKTSEEHMTVTDSQEKEITVPAGYYVIGKSQDNKILYADEANPTVDEGIVISDSLTDGNEFVWVPVEDIKKMVICQEHGSTISYNKDTGKFTCSGCSGKTLPAEDENNKLLLAGKLYTTNFGDTFDNNTFDANTTGQKYTADSGLREPDVLTDTFGGDASSNGKTYLNFLGITEKTDTDWENQIKPKWQKELQNGFDTMIESVAQYGGFYIGRYETGGLSGKVTTAVVKAGKGDGSINSTSWYYMYASSKNIAKDKKGVTSSMIWGSQWDQVMLWMKDVPNPTVEGKKYIEDSSGMGWYSDNSDKVVKATGTPINGNSGEVLNRVKNIYDMAGNVSEWTLECYNKGFRIIRGGDYDNSGIDVPASSENYMYPYSSYASRGSRTTLLCNPES